MPEYPNFQILLFKSPYKMGKTSWTHSITERNYIMLKRTSRLRAFTDHLTILVENGVFFTVKSLCCRQGTSNNLRGPTGRTPLNVGQNGIANSRSQDPVKFDLNEYQDPP